MREQANKSEKHGLHRQQGGSRPWHMSLQKLFKCLLVGWKRPPVQAFQLFHGRDSRSIEDKRAEQRGLSFVFRAVHRMECDSFDKK